MPVRVASVSNTSYAAIAAGANKFLTAAVQVGYNPSYNQGGNFMAAWQLICVSAGGQGSALPMFTWYDQAQGIPYTATANMLVATNASASYANFAMNDSSTAALSATQSRGIFFMPCGSGVSGVSAYLGYGISGAASGVRFNCDLFYLDGFAT
jgi:hypothetical protein